MAQKRKRSQPNNVTKYRKPVNLNIGMVIFAVILIYVVICIVTYLQTGHIVRYEVQKGSLATNSIYTGIVLRDEQTVSTSAAGYVNFYASEGTRVASGDLVYIVDETGRVSEELASMSAEDNTLSDSELREFRSEIVNFCRGYDRTAFSTVYEFKTTLSNTVQKLANENMLANIESLDSAGSLSSVLTYCYASDTGIVSCWTDGYETITADQVTGDMFDQDAYAEQKTQILNGTLLDAGAVAYKLTRDEHWLIVIPVESAEYGAELEEMGYIKVRFLKNQYESWGEVKALNNADGGHYVQLSFTNSMVTFAQDRFLEIELELSDETGLKIPVSAIAEKEFYLVPADFVTTSEDSEVGSVLRRYVTEDGDVSSQDYEITLYSYDEDRKVYYVDATILNANDTLIRTDSQETFTVSERATLTGVYNVNYGYADFRQISILEQNDEYAIVESNTQYGLNVYDYIALDADSVQDDQFIND